MYASRWFPFHDYAADRATSDITFIVPSGLQVAGTSDDPSRGAAQLRKRVPFVITSFIGNQS
jgi:hypothetical protein